MYIFLYVPIIILMLFSVNDASFPYKWVGFSGRWYIELFTSVEIWQAFKNSIIVATMAVILSLAMGLFLVFYSSRTKIQKFLPIFYGNLMVPEIVLAVGLLSLFTFCYAPLGLLTLIIGHTILGLGYVVPILSAGLEEIDYSIIEASLDLGASLNQTFVRIIIPLLRPSLSAASLLVFVVSFDDFLVSFFCGATVQTLPLYIFSMIRSGVSPTINALSTLLFLFSSFLVLGISFSKIRMKIF